MCFTSLLPYGETTKRDWKQTLYKVTDRCIFQLAFPPGLFVPPTHRNIKLDVKNDASENTRYFATLSRHHILKWIRIQTVHNQHHHHNAISMQLYCTFANLLMVTMVTRNTENLLVKKTIASVTVNTKFLNSVYTAR